MAEYPTPEGEVLSGILRDEMSSMFGSNLAIDDPFLSSCISCFSASSNPDISMRTENVKTHYATYNGLVTYMQGYSVTSGTTTGTAVGVGVETIEQGDDFEMYGTFDLNPPSTYLLYSFPMIFDVGKEVKDYKDQGVLDGYKRTGTAGRFALYAVK